MRESTIQKSIMDYLNLVLKEGYWARTNSANVILSSGNRLKTGRRGFPDIVGCYNGDYVGLEVKTPKGRQSDIQKMAEDDIIRNGGHYFVVRSISDVKEALKKIKAR